MATSEQLLTEAAQGHDFKIEEWPATLDWILSRLDSIVTNVFPPVVLPRQQILASQPEIPPTQLSRLEEAISQDDDQITKLEPVDDDLGPRMIPPLPELPSQSLAVDQASSVHALPQPLALQYASICSILTKNFSTEPPHSLQRLAELVLYPRQHYRFLPSYLNALDRVSSVSSPTTHFPLPQSRLPVASLGGVLDNDTDVESSGDLGSDASLGGALLTPIPWLRADISRSDSASTSPIGTNGAGGGEGTIHSDATETIFGPNGAGTIESVSVTINGIRSTTTTSPGGTPLTGSPTSDTPNTSSIDAELREQGAVTQGELLRQEQEAGVVPVATGAHRRNLGLVSTPVSATALSTSTGAMLDDDEMLAGEGPGAADEEEVPHARGPEEMTTEDLGPQNRQPSPGRTLDMEAAVGRKHPEPEVHQDDDNGE